MKKHRFIWIPAIVLVLLVNTHKYWSYKLNITGFVWLACLGLFLVLFFVLLFQFFKLFRERLQDRARIFSTLIVFVALQITFEWPDGFMPGTSPTDKLENLVMNNTGLDLHGYPYDIVTDSMDDDGFSGDYYYRLVVQYDEEQFSEIIEKIQQTQYYDVVDKYGQNESRQWDSLNVGELRGLWDDDDDKILFAPNPKVPSYSGEHFYMHVDKLTRQIYIEIIQT